MYDDRVDEDVVGVLATLVAVDVGGAGEVELGAAMRRLRRVRGWLDAFEAQLVERSDELGRAGQGRGGESLLIRNGRVSSQLARRTVRRAAVLTEAPALGDALAAGAVSAGHVDVFGEATRRASTTGRAALVERQDALAGLAVTQSPEEFAHTCRRITVLADDDGGLSEFQRQRRATRLRRFIDDATGMFNLHGQFDPELGTRIWRAIDHTVQVNYPPDQPPDSTPDGPDAADHLAALALTDIVTAAFTDEADDTDDTDGARPGPIRRPPRGEFGVIVDLPTLVGGLHAHSIIEVDPGGVTLPVDTLRRLACHADLLPIVLDGHGVTLDVGRAKRLATANQRRALRAMYPTCAITDCSVPFDHCEIHHLNPFGGPTGTGDTNLDQLSPLCSRHHHAAHEGHWQLHVDPATRTLTVTLPNGAIHTHPPPRKRTAA